MMELSYRRHRFPPVVIQHAIWLYLRFTLSYRDVEELLAERGLDISYETVRRWVLKFGPVIARRLRQSRPRPSDRWHLDESAPRTHDQQREGGAAWKMRGGSAKLARMPAVIARAALGIIFSTATPFRRGAYFFSAHRSWTRY